MFFLLFQIFYPREEGEVFSLHFVCCKMGGLSPNIPALSASWAEGRLQELSCA